MICWSQEYSLSQEWLDSRILIKLEVVGLKNTH